jgi:putative membrane protein
MSMLKHTFGRTSVIAVTLVMAMVFTASLVGAQQKAQQQQQQGAALPAADRAFANKAAVGGQAEVELGKLAQERASNDAVRQFGQRMAADHGKANQELMQLAQTKNLSLTTELDSKHRQLRDKLAKLQGNAFDKAYMNEMVKDHKTDVAEFKKQADRGKDPELKSWASQTLPTLQEHLRMAQDLDNQVKSSKSSSKSSEKPAR